MKVQLDLATTLTRTPITGSGVASQAIPGGAPAGTPLAAIPGTGDGIRISTASNALNRLSSARTAKINRLTGAVQGDSYQVSASSTSKALVEAALSGH